MTNLKSTEMRKEATNFFDLPVKEKRKIVMAAGREAQKMMQETIDKANALPPTPKSTEMRKEELYGVSFIENRIINRLKYSGRGRPRKTDYQTIEEAQKQINMLRNSYLDYLHFKI
jgi:isopenicillin N synthase-like dioxygenase